MRNPSVNSSQVLRDLDSIEKKKNYEIIYLKMN